MNALVSVIMPVHNGEKYLRECLDSVIGQTLKQLEIICVDDGSTDSSKQILNDYAAKDSRIRIVMQDASNAGHARNVGLSLATGKYLSFLDADDWFEPEMLNSMANLGEKENVDIIFCKAKTFDQKTGLHSKKSFSLKERLVPKGEIFSLRDMPEDAFQFCRTAAWDKLYRTSFIKKLGLQFQEQPRMNDCLFSTIANIRASRLIVCNEFFVHYRINTGHSITSISPDVAYSCTLNTFKMQQKLMSNEEKRVFGKSWKNFVLKNIVNEIATFSENVAFNYYGMLKQCNFGLDELKWWEIYDYFLYRMNSKYLEKEWTRETFKTAFSEFMREYQTKKRQSNLKKSLSGIIPLILSHRFSCLLRQIKNTI